MAKGGNRSKLMCAILHYFLDLFSFFLLSATIYFDGVWLKRFKVKNKKVLLISTNVCIMRTSVEETAAKDQIRLTEGLRVQVKTGLANCHWRSMYGGHMNLNVYFE